MIDLPLGAKALLVTPNRGKEFAYHADVTEYLNCCSIFHSVISRGKGDSTRIINSLFRECFSKSRDITEIPNDCIQRKAAMMNLSKKMS